MYILLPTNASNENPRVAMAWNKPKIIKDLYSPIFNDIKPPANAPTSVANNPKNLTMALSVEVSELLEIFQWSKNGGLDEIKDEKTKKDIEREIADVFNYIVRLSDILDIDILI